MEMPKHGDAPRHYSNFIDGHEQSALGGKTFSSINPTTGELWGTFQLSERADVDRAVLAARGAFEGTWGRLAPSQRGALLMRWGDSIASHARLIGCLESTQNGKLLAEMQLQSQVARDWLYYFGGMADKIEGAVIPLQRQSILNYTLREPLGVVAIITPWNSPTLLLVMSLAPALASGNTVVIKPSEITSASAVEIAKLASAVGIPAGVVNVVTGMRETGEALVDHPKVAKVAFTGSVGAGRSIAARVGARLATCTLELGGKSPHIVFDDADLDQAEAGLLSGIFAAAGQTCIAGSRAYLQEKVYNALVERLVTRAEKIVIGDPLLPTTQMGPIATKAQLQKDEAAVSDARRHGAELLCGGRRPAIAEFPGGYFFSPTILQGVAADNPLSKTEVFGPVLAIFPFRDEDDVVAKANDSEFGLAAGIWTRDIKRAHRMARRLESGTIWLNTYRALAANSPFGGYKTSGMGRLNGLEAIDNFLQTKSVWCELADEIRDPFVIKV